VNRRELVNALAERLETDRRRADAILSALTDLITETVAKGEHVAISGFAKFARVDRQARLGRNPQTGEPITIKASRRARITPLKAFKDAVLTGKLPAKKTTAKKTATKKTAAEKTAAKKRVPVKRAVPTKTAVKKTASKSAPANKVTAPKTARTRSAR
jgi:DNA-binding protein HU-beta